MSILVFSLVLLAALTHAIWNSWLKVSGDRLAALAALGAGWAVVGIAAIAKLGLPEPAVWTYLLASTVVHALYVAALIESYRLGDLSVAYPIARGIGPLVVVIVSTVFLDDAITPVGIAGALLIVAGALWLGLPRGVPGGRGLVFSVITGALIGTYTLLDGAGGRAGPSPHVFAAWLFLLTSIPVVAAAALVHGRHFGAMLRPALPQGVAAGALSAGAYWIVIWAMSEAPMGLVAALRESGVVFAALIGAWLLRERVRWIGVTLVFAGIVMTRLA